VVVADGEQARRTNRNASAAASAHILIEDLALQIEKRHVARYSVTTSGAEADGGPTFRTKLHATPGCESLTFEHNSLADATFSVSLLNRLCEHFGRLAAPDYTIDTAPLVNALDLRVGPLLLGAQVC